MQEPQILQIFYSWLQHIVCFLFSYFLVSSLKSSTFLFLTVNLTGLSSKQLAKLFEDSALVSKLDLILLVVHNQGLSNANMVIYLHIILFNQSTLYWIVLLLYDCRTLLFRLVSYICICQRFFSAKELEQFVLLVLFSIWGMCMIWMIEFFRSVPSNPINKSVIISPNNFSPSLNNVPSLFPINVNSFYSSGFAFTFNSWKWAVTLLSNFSLIKNPSLAALYFLKSSQLPFPNKIHYL